MLSASWSAFIYVLAEKGGFLQAAPDGWASCSFPGSSSIPARFYFKAELTLSGNLNKIGGVFLLLCLSDWLLRRCGGRFLDLLKKAGTESLFVYVLHLFIIFNSVFGKGLNPLFANSLNVFQALLLFLALQLVVFALSLLYHHIKEKHPLLWRWGFNIFWAGSC